MVYVLLRLLLRSVALDLFFRSVEVEDPDHVPETGPIVLAANHPNTFLDVVLVGTLLERRLNFVAKAPLFRNRFQAIFLRMLGAVPVERRMERAGAELDEAAREKNARALAACEDAIARGGAVLIFPEGTSHDAPRLLPLKTGAARIALGAEAKREGDRPVAIVPVSLFYDDPKSFRSRVRVRFGEPVSVAPYAAIAREDDARAIRALTEAVREGMEPGVVHLDDPGLVDLVKEIDELFGRRLASTVEAGRLAATPAIARAVNHFARRDPARVERVRALVHEYHEELAAAGLDDRAVRPGTARPSAESTFALVATSPLWLWGFLHHLVPYQIPRLATSFVSDPTAVSSVKLVTGILAFSAWYVLETWAAWRLGGTWWAVAHAGSLPVTGLVTLLAVEGLLARARLRRRDKARARAGADRVRALREKRERIWDELDRARAEWLATETTSA